MNGHAKAEPLNRLRGLLGRCRAGSARRFRPAHCAVRSATAEDGATQGLLEWAHTPAPVPWLEGTEYRYHLGSHGLILATYGVDERHEAAVGRAVAEFALVVEGPLLVFGHRFGTAPAWTWAAPYNWHFAPPAERVAPAAVPLTPETYSRLWATLWITLVDTATGRARIRRAVALRPEFTHALHGVLREQAMRPFRVEAAEWALDRLRYVDGPLAPRARVRTRCAAVSDYGGGWLTTRAGRDDRAHGISTRHQDDSGPECFDHHHRRILDAHPPYPGPSPPLPGGPGRRPVARGRCGPPDQSTDPCPRFRLRPEA
jgi:hypothetical protein